MTLLRIEHTAHPRRGGNRWKYFFDNGFGASLIDNGYGSDEGLYEIGTLWVNDDGSTGLGELPGWDRDCIGRLNPLEVLVVLRAIAAQPRVWDG